MQTKAIVLRLRVVPLEGCVVFHQGNNDLASVSVVLLPDQDEISILNADLDHRVTIGAKKEKSLHSEQSHRKLDVFLYVFLRELLDVAGDAPENGDPDDLDLGFCGGDAADTGIVDHACLAQLSDVSVHSRF